MASITSDNAALAITKLVAAEALDTLINNLVMGQLVNRNYDGQMAQSGNTIDIPIPSPMTPNNLAEGGSTVEQTPVLGNAQITLQRHLETTFSLPDFTRSVVTPDIIRMQMREAIEGMANQVETDILGLYPLFTTTAAVGTANTPLTEAVVDSAETALFSAKVPQSDPLSLVVSPASYGVLRQIPRFTEMQTVGSGSPIQTGLLLKSKSFNIYRSQLVPIVAGSPTTYNVGFARDAMCLVVRRLNDPMPGTGVISAYAERAGYAIRVTTSYKHSILGHMFTADFLYGTGVLRSSFGIQVKS